MMDKKPNCLCGENQWDPRGATIGSKILERWFVCLNCDRKALYIRTPGGEAFITTSIVSDDFSEDGVNWINGALFVFWRDVFERLTKVRKVIESEACNTFFRNEGLPQETTYKAMKEEQQPRFKNMLDMLRLSPNWLCPTSFERQGLPPAIPLCITVFYPLKDGKWQTVTHAETADIQIPADPIRVRHDTYFNEVFDELEKVFGRIERTEIENQYHGSSNQPWYQFNIGGYFFTIGPRKRVVSIHITTPESIEVTDIRDLALRDGTTYSADSKYNSAADTAYEVSVHAWTKEKLLEYLLILGKERTLAAA